ncbi:AAA family ATPase [Methylobacterium sp. J-030]|uniref:ATP-binding protein n=1 Tax=Methylobacterium sp. J-030 TaxID=2836627 RepID=UPI001FB8FF92|nr:AAA family ATPase [Methylobacterium sp. J-030]MCJ2067316.1 AAA family ATPase [Methylobacterium sp. J-030]
MRLAYVELCGFRGFREKIRVDFGVSFTVIVGRNGVGKSTLCDAVEFAITGEINKYQVEKAARESIADYYWWRGEGTPKAHFVTVGFRDDDGRISSVTRTRGDGANMVPEAIERLLCFDALKPDQALRQLCRTSIIRDEWIAATSLDLTETDRFNLVRAALGAVEGPEFVRKAQDTVAAAETVRVKAERDYEDRRLRLSDALTELAETRGAVANAGDVTEALSVLGVDPASTDGIATGISAIRANLSDRHVRLGMLARLAEEVQRVHESAARFRAAAFQDDVDRLERDVWTSTANAKSAAAIVAAAEVRVATEQAADELAASLASLIDHGAKIGLHDGCCPLCDAIRTTPEFEEGLGKARARLAELCSGLAAARNAASEARGALASARRAVEAARSSLAELIGPREELGSREATLMAELRRLKLDPMDFEPERLDAYAREERSRLVDLERAILTVEASQAIGRVAELERKVGLLREDADEAAGHLTRAQAAVTAAKSLDRSVKRTNAEIVDERLATISPLLNELYQRLRPHREWRDIEYSIRGDVRRLLSLKIGDNLNPQFVFSSGQRRAAGLAFLLSVHLSRPWCQWKTLVLDDPVQHIDDFRALHLVEVLTAMRQTGRQIVCAVEDASLAELMCRRLVGTIEEPGRRIDLDLAAGGAAVILKAGDIEPVPVDVLGGTWMTSAVS